MHGYHVTHAALLGKHILQLLQNMDNVNGLFNKFFIFFSAILICVRAAFIVSTCLDVVDIYPNPSSVVYPVDRNSTLSGVQVTFSRPVQEIQDETARMQSVLLTNVITYRKLSDFSVFMPIKVYPVKIYFGWYGSERSIFVIFNITNTELKAR